MNSRQQYVLKVITDTMDNMIGTRECIMCFLFHFDLPIIQYRHFYVTSFSNFNSPRG